MPCSFSFTDTSSTMTPDEEVIRLISSSPVFIFSKSYCPDCKRVKDLFTSLGIEYQCVELDLMGDEGIAIHAALIKKTGQSTVPSVFINKNHIGGADSTIQAHENGMLIKMLGIPYDHYDYDLIVIGGGSGGLAASREAARCGKKVAVCDYVVRSPHGTTWGLGGTCVNVGCIPKKLMHKASLIGEDIKDSTNYGWTHYENVEHDWNKMIEGIQSHIKSLNFGYRKALKSEHVDYFNAYAKFVSANKVQTTDKKNNIKELTARHFIIAVGGRPIYPDIPGAREFAITSDDLFSLPYSPKKTLLIGASYVALECAGFLSGLGYDTTIMVRSILLRGFDQQMAEFIGNHMQEHSVKFLRECVPERIEKIADGSPGIYSVSAIFNDGTKITDKFNTIIIAVGREACTRRLGLEAIGVQLNIKNSKIIVDTTEQTTVSNIYAIGDVIDGKPELTPVAIQAGKLLAQRLYGGKSTLTDYTCIPTTVFTPLEYGCAGLSEEDAIKNHGVDNIEVYHAFYQPLEFALPQKVAKPYGKLVCVKSEDERVVGFHVLGPNAGEITQGYAIGLKLGAKKADFSNLIGIHPTCAEVFTTMNTTKSSGESVEKTSC